MITYWHNNRHHRLWRHNRNTNRSPWHCDNTYFKPTSVATMNACNICVKILQHRSSLSRHKRMHHTARRYSCSNCSKQYRWKEYLTKHAKKWDGIPPATDDVLSVTPPAVNTPKGSPTSYTIMSLYDTCSKTWANRTNKLRNFHLILIIMNDGYVLCQLDVMTEKVTHVPTQNAIYWIQNQQKMIHCFI